MLVPEDGCFGLMKCFVETSCLCLLPSGLVVCAVSGQYIPGFYLVISKKTWPNGLNWRNKHELSNLYTSLLLAAIFSAPARAHRQQRDHTIYIILLVPEARPFAASLSQFLFPGEGWSARMEDLKRSNIGCDDQHIVPQMHLYNDVGG